MLQFGIPCCLRVHVLTPPANHPLSELHPKRLVSVECAPVNKEPIFDKLPAHRC